MTPEPEGHPAATRSLSSARTKLLVSFGAAIVGGAVAATAGAGRAAPLIGWDILAVIYCGWVWSTLRGLDPVSTARHARREEPSRDLADLVLLCAAIAIEAGLALASVFVSWTLVHTVFTLKYARLYYSGTPGGIDFNEAGPPDYPDCGTRGSRSRSVP